jgi:hypothetical protein
MRSAGVFLGIALLSSSVMRSQSAPPTIYAESFRKGATRITEESRDIKLTPDKATFRERLKDGHGSERYELTISPQGPEGDTKVTSWVVRLRDLHHSIYSNILQATQEPSADPGNKLGWLNPDRYGTVPIGAKRIMKVDGFYIVIQVTSFHFTPVGSPYLDSMGVQVAFVNRDPRSSGP